jgi:hypothetical protein
MTREQFEHYARGYYRALVAALRAMEHVVVRRALWMRDRRRRARLAALERARLADAPDARGAEAIGVLGDHLGADVAEHRQQVRGEFHAVIALRQFIAEDEPGGVSAGVEIERRDAVDEVPLHRHPATLAPAIDAPQHREGRERISKCDGDAAVVGVGDQCEELAPRSTPRQTRSRRRKETRKF